MNDELKLKNNLKEARTEKKLSQTQLAEMIGVSCLSRLRSVLIIGF